MVIKKEKKSNWDPYKKVICFFYDEMLNFTTNRNLFNVETRVLNMSNVNKRELYVRTWKTDGGMLIGSILCGIMIPWMWFRNYANIDLELMLVTGGLLILAVWFIYMYKRGYVVKRIFPLEPEKRLKIIEKNIISGIKFNHYYDSKIEGSEETLRGEIKTVLLKLAQEC